MQMRKVYNWQLGRNAAYVYPQHRPKKQWAMVFDLNKCISCQTCSLACKTTWTSGKGQSTCSGTTWRRSPTAAIPWDGTAGSLQKLGFQDWMGDKYAGKTLFEAAEKDEKILQHLAEDADWAHPNIGEDEVAATVNRGGLDHHAPPDLDVLPPEDLRPLHVSRLPFGVPAQGDLQAEEDGIVLIDQSRCRGYRECVRACPYKKSMFNVETRISEKCIGCYPKIEQGDMPQCVTNCIGKIRLHGYLSTPDKARKDNPIDYLVHERKLALPLYPQFGTEPNSYYIPPIHAPLPYLGRCSGRGRRRRSILTRPSRTTRRSKDCWCSSAA